MKANNLSRLARASFAIGMLIAGAKAPADEFGGVVFKKPVGWEATPKKDVVILTCSAATKGNALVAVVSRAMPVSANGVKSDFDRLVANTEKDAKSTLGDVSETKKNGLTYLTRSATTDDKDGLIKKLYLLVSDDKHIAFMVVISQGEKTMDTQREAIQLLLTTLQPSQPENKAASGVPYAEVDANMGDVKWRPSGRGTAIPAAKLVNGQPQGLWWTYSTNNLPTPQNHLFLPDHTLVMYPQLGGPNLFDMQAETRHTSDYVGKWEISGDRMARTYHSGTTTTPFTAGRDQYGETFKAGRDVFRPCTPVSAKALVGEWEIKGTGSFVFGADGSVSMFRGLVGSIKDLDYTGPDILHGTYSVHGYLLVLNLGAESYRVYDCYMAQPGMLAIGGYFYLPKRTHG